MILLLDNYDSFTYNLQHYLALAGAKCDVKRNDEIDISSTRLQKYRGIVLSPGPGVPQQAGQLMHVLQFAKDIPVLGICLGHQAIGIHFGAVLEKAKRPMHGKLSHITIHQHAMFKHTCPKGFDVVRYHSLVLRNVPDELEVTAQSIDDNEVMALAHKTLPVWGVQFHPEAALTQFGKQLVCNWVNHFALSEN